MKNGKGIYNDIKDDRKFKLLTIKNNDIIRQELISRKLNFTEEYGLYTVVIKGKTFFIQVDLDSIVCWVRFRESRDFNFCDYGLDIEEFVMELDDIIECVDKLYKLKAKIDKKINEIEVLVNTSDIHGVEINDWFFDDLLFENIICTDEN